MSDLAWDAMQDTANQEYQQRQAEQFRIVNEGILQDTDKLIKVKADLDAVRRVLDLLDPDLNDTRAVLRNCELELNDEFNDVVRSLNEWQNAMTLLRKGLCND